MNPRFTTITVLDDLAAHLASLSGVDWCRLHNHPGYERNYWRDRARQTLDALNNPYMPRHYLDTTSGWVVSNQTVP